MLRASQFSLFATGMAIVFSAMPAGAEPTAGCFDHLPQGTLAALRVAQLDQLNERLEAVCGLLKRPVPPVVSFALQLEGVDPEGEAALGITRTANGGYLPFVLLPVADYKAFVRAGDGDPGLAATPLTLAGEELLAGRRGQWVLLTNVVADFSAMGSVSSDTAKQTAALSEDQLFSVVITPAGLETLQSLAQSTPVTSRSLAYRRRLLASRQMDWTDPAQWQARLGVYGTTIDRWVKDCEAVVAGVDIAGDKSVDIQIRMAPREPLEVAPATMALPAVELTGERRVIHAEGPIASPWTTTALSTLVDRVLATPDGVGVEYFDPSAMSSWHETVLRLGEQLKAARFTMIAPDKEQPVMCNSAYLCQVKQADEFLAALDSSFAAWNTLIERSRRDEDLIFEIAPLRVEELAGKRYSVDLPSAVRQEDIPDVRQVMQQMFGRNGRMVIDAVPISANYVLVSDLPDVLRDQLIAQLKAAPAASSTEASAWTMTIKPDAWQDWSNEVKRVSMGGNIIGWKPKRIATDATVTVRAETQAPTLLLRARIPGEVVAAIAGLWIEN